MLRLLNSKQVKVLVVAVAGVAVLGVLGLTVLMAVRDGSTRPGRRAAAEPAPAPARAPSGTPTIPGPSVPPADPALFQGRPSATVTIVQFGDYRCAKCASFARHTKPELLRRYDGVVRFVWRDFPESGKPAEQAAVAARAAGRQQMFWAFHDALYARKSASLSPRGLRAVAQRLGLDLTRFDTDRRDPKLREAVKSDHRFGQELGLPAAPAYFVNGNPVFGDQPVRVFTKAIEAAQRGR